ncbi:hypothetical protein Tco_1427340 [Tanacetum coccineum]
MSNKKNDRVLSASKSSCIKNKDVEIEEHHRNLLLSKNKKDMSSECNNIKLAIRNDKSEVVCSINIVKKSKKLGSNEILASSKLRKHRTYLRWSPTRRNFDLSGQLIVSSKSECQSDSSEGDNACASNPQEPTNKQFPNSTSFLGRLSKLVYDTVMSDSDESTVTYTEVSSPFEGFSGIGSPGVAPPSPDYIPGPEKPQSPPLPDFVSEPVYPEYMPQEDEVFLAEEQPLPAAASPTTQSPDYVLESDPEEDPEEDDDEGPEEDPVDYPADGGDDGDDEDESSKDDEDDDVDIEADDDEEEEEHPAPADSTSVALPAVDQAPSAKETEQFETDKEKVERLLAMPTPPSSPLSPWSSPLPHIPSPPLPTILSPLPVSPPLPQISSPPLPVSSPVPVLSPSPPASPIGPLGYRAAMIRLRAEAASTSHLLPLPPPIILSHTRPDAPSSGTPPFPRYEVKESSSAATARPAGGLRADYDFVATMNMEIRHDLERDVRYGITDSWDKIVEAIQGTPVVTDVIEFSQRMTEFETRVRQDTNEIYTRLDDEQSERQLMAGRLNMLYRDRRAHARTARLMETEDHEVKPRNNTAAKAATTTTITNAQLQAMIDQGVTAILAARDANTNGVDSFSL